MKRLVFVSVAAMVITACADVTQPNDELSQLDRLLLGQSTSSTSDIENGATLFGPEVFNRGRGTPVTETRSVTGDDFDNFEAPFVLHLLNGTQDGRNRVSSAHVVLDGVELFGPSDFSQQVGELSTDIDLNEDSELMVTLVSRPGSQITIEIEGMLKAVEGVKVEPGGGEVVIIEDKVTLDFPPGAIEEDIFITATPVPESELPDDPTIVPGTAFEFGPSGTTFLEPVTLCIQYDEDLLPDGTDESELRIHLLIDGSFTQLDAGLVDTENNIVCAEVDHFSVFVILPRVLGRDEDIEAPEMTDVTVSADGVSFGATAAIDVSNDDVAMFVRFSGTDDVTGIEFMVVVFENSRSNINIFERQCFASGDPLSPGSDTNGDWLCSMVFPQYSPSGTWRVSFAETVDKVGNRRNYFRQGEPGDSLCDFDGGCVSWDPEIEVTSDSEDVILPSITDFAVSLDVDPRTFEQSVTIDVSASDQDVVFKVGMLDDLSGIQSVFLQLQSPGGGQFRFCFSSFPVSGTRTDGDWECTANFPQFSEEGTWSVTFAEVRDLVGNGNTYNIQSDGRLCNFPDMDCIAEVPPTVVVVSSSDITPPVLTGFSLLAVDATVTVTLDVTDELSGVNRIFVSFESSNSTQSQFCFTNTPSTGTRLDGTWECSFTFPLLSATGPWPLSFLELIDEAGNRRFYSRRASDGFLCTGAPEVCEDFGDTEIIVQVE